ncbi:MAG: hypothetical protein H0V19_01755 [Euzebyales bacterium]|nr:hypothetical protein [Euzebyales bacterium]
MKATASHHLAATVLGVLSALYAATFFLGALLHTGTRVPVGFAVLAEPRIDPAIVVESLCGSALAVGAYALLTGRRWAWAAAIASHAFALAGVLLGTAAVAAGRGPHSVLNDTYHRVMIVVLIAGLVALSMSAVKTALRHRNGPLVTERAAR